MFSVHLVGLLLPLGGVDCHEQKAKCSLSALPFNLADREQDIGAMTICQQL